MSRPRAVNRLRVAALAALALTVAIPEVAVGGAAVGYAAVATLALAAVAGPDRWGRLAATGAPALAVATLAAAALQGAGTGLVGAVVAAVLLSLHLVLADAAESGDGDAARRAVPSLALGGAAALVVALVTTLPGLPWLWVPIAGGVAALVAYRHVVGGLRSQKSR